MSVWVCTPSARPVEEVEPWARTLRRLGYKIALWRDSTDFPYVVADYIRSGTPGRYPGYSVAANALIADVMALDALAEWFVVLADDTEPDLSHTADEIAAQCDDHFDDHYDLCCEQGVGFYRTLTSEQGSTFGVMQPTGDRFAGGQIDRICGSPWIGREFARRINGGRGPFWPEYTHMFVDEELQNVAIRNGVLWQRPDLIHLHRHHQRESDAIGSNAVHRADPPPHMRADRNDGYTPEHWQKYEALFKTRRAQGFPGSEPL